MACFFVFCFFFLFLLLALVFVSVCMFLLWFLVPLGILRSAHEALECSLDMYRSAIALFVARLPDGYA